MMLLSLMPLPSRVLAAFLAVAAVVLFGATPVAPAADASRIVMMIGEDEYHTWETLPEFADKDLRPLGYQVTIVHADEANKNDFRGLVDALREADLLFISVRRRTPVKEQLEAV